MVQRLEKEIWDLGNDNLYFVEEAFANSTVNVRAGIPEALGKMGGIKTLTVGHTKDIELAEKVARATDVRRLSIQTCPEGYSLNLNEEERPKWLDQSWRLEGRRCIKL